MNMEKLCVHGKPINEVCFLCQPADQRMLFRKCFVLREVEIPMEELRRGDIFRQGKASPSDCCDEYDYNVANNDAILSPDGNTGITATGIALKPESKLPWGLNSLIMSQLRNKMSKGVMLWGNHTLKPNKELTREALSNFTVSLVTHCPYCGTDDWDTPKEKADGTICEHPTKITWVK